MAAESRSLPSVLLDLWRTGRAGPPAVAARQERRLAGLIEFAREHSPFYRGLYGASPITARDLPSLPPVTKPELMTHFDSWVTDREVTRAGAEAFAADVARVGEPYLGRYFLCTSSGTTGHPGIFLHDPAAVAVYQAIVAVRSYLSWLTPVEAWAIARMGAREAMVLVTGGHFGGTAWMERARRQAWAARLVHTFSVLSPLGELVQELDDFQPAILCAYPSALALLAEEQAAGRLHTSPVFTATAGESFSATTRERIETAFGCPLRDAYGASEFLYMAFSCVRGWLHLSADWALLEPVDEAYRPVPPGKPSHTVLLTNLANRLQPFIRYDLGDSITVKPEACECGSRLPAIRVEGRQDDVLYLETPGGRRTPILPLALATVVEETPGVHRFQVIQTGPAVVRIRLEVVPGTDEASVWEALAGRLQQYLAAQGVLMVRIERAAEPPQRNPVSGKFRQVWVESPDLRLRVT